MASASKSHMYCLLTNLNQKHSRKGIPGNIVQLSQNDTLEANHTDKIEVSTRVQFSSVAQLCPTLRDPMNSSTPGLPVHL